MLSIKLVALRHQKVPLIFDSVTSLPLLYPLLFSQSKLFTKAFNTQLASLQAVKSFYDFWSSKYHCSFCFSFWQAKTYPLIAIQEMENFSIFLREGSLSNIYRENLKEISSITTATRVRAVLQFIVYLNDEFVSSRYIDLSHTEVIAMHNYLSKMINLKRQELCQFSKSNLRKNNNHQPYSSLNSNMVKDLFSMLLPSTLKQVNANNPFKKIETQFRNYLIFRLLINYGLRIGELLLLQTDSVKRTSRGSYALVITNSEDYDERIHSPSIKTKDSHRILELDVFDYRLIRTYVDEIRHSINSSPVLFTTISPPYKPLDYQAIRFACETISNKFKDLYPYHFDKSQLDSITSINLHMCRHTWATFTLSAIYRTKRAELVRMSKLAGVAYTIELNYEGTINKWVLEDMLFITQVGATCYDRTLTQLTTFDILSTTMLNNWLGGSCAVQKSVFQHYELKDDNGEYSALKTHMPRHNINTFLALTGLSEILQAMLMGRVDVTQNQHYQHLAVLELKKAVKTQLASIESVDMKAPPALSPVEICAQDGQMLFSNALDLEKNLKRNLHTFDGQEDVTEFLSDVINSDDPFGDEFLSDFKDSLAAKGSKTVLQTKEALETHAYLFPVLNGACMRDVRKDGCPSRLKCVAGAGCCNFVVTGRQGELDNLISLRNTLEISVKKAEALAQNDARYQRAFIEQRQNLTNIQMAVEKTYRARQQLVPVRVFPDAPNLSNFGGAKPTLSLVDLFASEQVKLEMVKVRKTQDAE